ncbi:hypothetical protein RND81_14G189900 [Saponaria officinalis]|uniref:poly(A)-specific ribonuclease n=1 Tax=Saponaria officinalis TaxID=3572 RepID=A0AAW1GVI8_SAPOF
MTENSPKEMSFDYEIDSVEIREVYESNLDEEFKLINEIVDEYPYIAMDTEFPGTVSEPKGNLTPNECYFRTIKKNVNSKKIIQLGLTFFDENGRLPTCKTDKYCIWQFNFREFNLEEDDYVEASIDMLRKNGIDFEKFNNQGVDAIEFAKLLIPSGAVLNENVTWVGFHCGMDFGYLIKLLTCRKIPETQKEFLQLLNTFCLNIYDVKQMMRFTKFIGGGLEELGKKLELKRIGSTHQAGSDSLLTCCAFRKLKHECFAGSVGVYAGSLYSLDVYRTQNP